MKNEEAVMIALLLFLILAVILTVVFANMTLYVVGGLIGFLIVLFVFIIKRRNRK